jgi:diacylglycerol O-acyltransferase
MEQLSGLDAAFVHQESRRSPMHVTAVLIYDIGADKSGAISRDELRGLSESRLAQFPVFRRKLHRVPMGMDTPYWVDVAAPDWLRHIRESTLAASAAWVDFQNHLSGFHSSQLDLEQPLWEMQLIHGLSGLPGLPAECQALALKVHHAAIDGMSLAAIIRGLHDESTDTSRPQQKRMPRPSDIDLWSRANINYLGRQFKLIDTVRNLLPGLARAHESRKQFGDLPSIHNTGSLFNDRVGAARTTGAVLWPAAEVLQIKRAVRRVTLNDIALACVGGALRQYLGSRGKLSRKSLASGVPISLRNPGDKDAGGNKIATMVVGLATHIADPVERLRMVHRYAVAGKKQINALGSGTVMDISDSLTPGILAEGIRTLAWASRIVDVPVPFHTMISNVPGPQAQMFLGKAELIVPLGLGPIRDNLGLFHIVSGSRQMMSISFVACAELLPDASFYERCLADAFTELHECALE